MRISASDVGLALLLLACSAPLPLADLSTHSPPLICIYNAELGENHADLLPADAQALLLDASISGSLDDVERALVAGADIEAAGTHTRSFIVLVLVLMLVLVLVLTPVLLPGARAHAHARARAHARPRATAHARE
jgi:hypothetical protein